MAKGLLCAAQVFFSVGLALVMLGMAAGLETLSLRPRSRRCATRNAQRLSTMIFVGSATAGRVVSIGVNGRRSGCDKHGG